MTPADPVWLLAEVLASVARMVREHRKQRAERRRLAALLPGSSFLRRRSLLANLAVRPRLEPAQLPDVLYARVQAALLDFSRRRDTVQTGRSVQGGRAPAATGIAWQVVGREVTVTERSRPLFRAVWSSCEGGWRLYWAHSEDRWWPYVSGSHLSIGSFESCVREVERDPRGCFPPFETTVKNRG